jgi:hypothetical protein
MGEPARLTHEGKQAGASSPMPANAHDLLRRAPARQAGFIGK